MRKNENVVTKNKITYNAKQQTLGLICDGCCFWSNEEKTKASTNCKSDLKVSCMSSERNDKRHIIWVEKILSKIKKDSKNSILE